MEFACKIKLSTYRELIKKRNLTIKNIREKKFSNIDFSELNFDSADFRSANFDSADFKSANFDSADFKNCNVFSCNGIALSCPEKGEFIGYKKCQNNIIVELKIFPSAKRSSATTRKCRASKVEVLKLSDNAKVAYSLHPDYDQQYRKGDIIEVKNFDNNRWNECSTGIHFFITRKEAELYILI